MLAFLRRCAGCLFVVSLSTLAAFAQQPPACSDNAGFSRLDFWVGEWVVQNEAGTRYGTNTIEKILDGCAVLEHWTGVEGMPGKSLFYYLPALDIWRQVWVTPAATVPGGVKEKELVETFADGGVRFQGKIALPNGNTYLDRTTLTPLPDGRVRQVIEISQDEGATWRTTFDALYIRAEG